MTYHWMLWVLLVAGYVFLLLMMYTALGCALDEQEYWSAVISFLCLLLWIGGGLYVLIGVCQCQLGGW